MITALQAKGETRDRNVVVQEQVVSLLQDIEAQILDQATLGFHQLKLQINTEADIMIALVSKLTEFGYTTIGDDSSFSVFWE